MSLSNFIASYPDRRGTNFQRSFNSKFEFASLSSDMNEKLKGRPSFFKHQRLTHRVLRVYPKLLVIDEPGTGKTCSIEGFTEDIAKAKRLAKLNPDVIPDDLARVREMFIVVKGSAVMKEVVSQLACKCSDGRYEPDPTVYKDLSAAVNRSIKLEGYRVNTYGSFVKTLAKRFGFQDSEEGGDYKVNFLEALLNDEDVRNQVRIGLADTFFWFDEGHNLVRSESKGKASAEEDFGIIYRITHAILHLALRPFVVITTATPAINTYTEFYKLANLIIDDDGYIPDGMDPDELSDDDFLSLFPEFEGDRHTASLDKLGRYYKPQFSTDYSDIDYSFIEVRLRGMISYVRAFSPEFIKKILTTYPEQLSKKDQKTVSKLELYPIVLSKQQSMWYRSIAEEADNNTFKDAEMGAAIFVYPSSKDKGYLSSSKGYKKNFDSQGNLLSNSWLPRIFSSSLAMKERGMKLYQIGKIVKENKELIIIVSDPVTGSGVFLIAQYLSSLGFQIYDGKNSLLDTMATQEGRSFCAKGTKDSDSQPLKRNFSKKCAMIYGDSKSVINNIKAAANSSYNVDGGLIRAVIISKAASEGISFLGVKRIILVNAKWTDSAKEQAEARAIRADSYTLKGPILSERAGHKVMPVIEVQRMTAYLNDGTPTSDLKMYVDARSKGAKIKKVLRIAKTISLSCTIHKDRNVRPEDKDYSTECDYLKCGYKCSGSFSGVYDYSTYDVYYAHKDLDPIVARIVDLFIFERSLRFDVIRAKLSDLRPYMIESALIKIAIEKIPLRDSYGVTCYLREDNGIFFTDRTYPKEILGRPESYHYSSEINAVTLSSLSEISDRDFRYDEGELNDLIIGKASIEKFMRIGTVHQKAQLLEKIVMMSTKGIDYDRKIVKPFVDRYRKFVYSLKEPVDDLYAVDNEMKNAPKKVGKPISINKEDSYTKNMFNKKEILQDFTIGGETVKFHTLYGQKKSLGSTNLSRNFMKPPIGSRIRIFKVSEGVWRDAIKLEEAFYRRVAYTKNVNKLKLLTTIDPETNNLKRLVVFVLEDGKISFLETISGSSWGKTCGNYTTIQLLGIVSKYKFVPKGKNKSDRNTLIHDVMKALKLKSDSSLKALETETLRDYIIFIEHLDYVIGKEDICDELYKIMKAKKLELV